MLSHRQLHLNAAIKYEWTVTKHSKKKPNTGGPRQQFILIPFFAPMISFQFSDAII